MAIYDQVIHPLKGKSHLPFCCRISRISDPRFSIYTFYSIVIAQLKRSSKVIILQSTLVFIVNIAFLTMGDVYVRHSVLTRHNVKTNRWKYLT